MPINILIGCRISLFAEAVEQLLAKEADLHILGRLRTEAELLEISQMQADLLLADHDICDRLFTMRSLPKGLKVLLFNNNPYLPTTGGELQDLIAKGLAGVLPNNADSRTLKKAIRAIHAGELWLDHRTVKASLCSSRDSRGEVDLTHKEKEVCELLCMGYCNKEVAQRLFICEQTVKSHCNRIYKKFGVKNRVKLALCLGWKAPENPLLEDQ